VELGKAVRGLKKSAWQRIRASANLAATPAAAGND
jgi:hypothetical protein